MAEVVAWFNSKNTFDCDLAACGVFFQKEQVGPRPPSSGVGQRSMVGIKASIAKKRRYTLFKIESIFYFYLDSLSS